MGDAPGEALGQRLREMVPDMKETYLSQNLRRLQRAGGSAEELEDQAIEWMLSLDGNYPRAASRHSGERTSSAASTAASSAGAGGGGGRRRSGAGSGAASSAGGGACASAQEQADATDWREFLERAWEAELRGDPELRPSSLQGDRSFEYNLHALHALLVRFPRIPKPVVRKTFLQHGTFSAALAALEQRDDAGKQLKRPRREDLPPPPSEVPADLVCEIAYGPHAAEIDRTLEKRRRQRKKRIAELKRSSGFLTCGCCFDDELIPEEAVSCNGHEAHAFCRCCVKSAGLEFFGRGLFTQNFYGAARASSTSASSSSSSSSSGPSAASSSSSSSPGPAAPEGAGPGAPSGMTLGLCTLGCLSAGSPCAASGGGFSEGALQRALPPDAYRRWTSRSTALQAILSGLEDLAACPSCDFMVQMGDPQEGVVRCQNRLCRKVSCRWCGRDEHRPLRCDEVEGDSEVALRTFLEEQMTDAAGKRCPNQSCQKLYERVDGCNKMHCVCGTYFCYLCGTVLDKRRPYNHYRDGHLGGGQNALASRCVVYGTPKWARRSARDVEHDAERALEAYLKAHPELEGLPGERLRKVRQQVGLPSQRRARGWLEGALATCQVQ